MNPHDLKLSDACLRAEELRKALETSTLGRDCSKQLMYAHLYGADSLTLEKLIKANTVSVAKGNFIIGSVREDGSLSFAERPVVHPTAREAEKEVERLVELNPGKRFAYLELKGVAYTPIQSVKWSKR